MNGTTMGPRQSRNLAYRESRARDFRAWAGKPFNADIGARRLLEVHARLAAVRHDVRLEVKADY